MLVYLSFDTLVILCVNKPVLMEKKADLYITCCPLESTSNLFYVYIHLEEIPARHQVIIKAVG